METSEGWHSSRSIFSVPKMYPYQISTVIAFDKLHHFKGNHPLHIKENTTKQKKTGENKRTDEQINRPAKNRLQLNHITPEAVKCVKGQILFLFFSFYAWLLGAGKPLLG